MTYATYLVCNNGLLLRVGGQLPLYQLSKTDSTIVFKGQQYCVEYYRLKDDNELMYMVISSDIDLHGTVMRFIADKYADYRSKINATIEFTAFVNDNCRTKTRLK